MSQLQLIDKGAGYFLVDGDLTFSTIGKKTVKSLEFLSSAKEITLDLSGVVTTDSAGLALMIEWVKYARGNRIQVTFKKIPQQLLNLAKLSGLDKTNCFIMHPDG